MNLEIHAIKKKKNKEKIETFNMKKKLINKTSPKTL